MLTAELEPRVEVVREIAPLVAEWDGLARRTRASPFLRPGWISAWWRAFEPGTLCILAVRREGQLSGVLPLVSRRGELDSPTNWHSPEFGLLAETLADRAALSRALFEQAPRRASISFLSSGDDVAALREAAEAVRYRALVRTLTSSPAIRTTGDCEEYKSSLGRNLRKNLRRNLRQLGELGRLRLDVEEGGDRLDALLEEGFLVESLAWKGARKTAIVSRPETRRFYEEVGRWAAREGMLRLFFLRLDGRALAFEFALQDQGVLYTLKGGYEPRYARYSPGILLLYRSCMYAFEQGLERYELLPGMEPYKLAWATDICEITVLRAFAPTLPGRLDRAVNIYGRPLARSVGLRRILSKIRK